MQKKDLEHLIRAAADVTNQYEFIIVGSQSILGTFDFPPEACVTSNEADIYPLNDETLSDKIDGAIGEGSLFHETHGYYAQGVDSTTCVLPDGWMTRLSRLQNENTNGRVGYCLDPIDLIVSKLVANREKDREFNKAIIDAELVKPGDILTRIDKLSMKSPQERDRLKEGCRRLLGDHNVRAPVCSALIQTLKAGSSTKIDAPHP